MSQEYTHECAACGTLLHEDELCVYCGSELQVRLPPSLAETYALAPGQGWKYFDTSVWSMEGYPVGVSGYVDSNGRYIARHVQHGRDGDYEQFTVGSLE